MVVTSAAGFFALQPASASSIIRATRMAVNRFIAKSPPGAEKPPLEKSVRFDFSTMGTVCHAFSGFFNKHTFSTWLGSWASNGFHIHCTREWWNSYFRPKMGMSNRYECPIALLLVKANSFF